MKNAYPNKTFDKKIPEKICIKVFCVEKFVNFEKSLLSLMYETRNVTKWIFNEGMYATILFTICSKNNDDCTPVRKAVANTMNGQDWSSMMLYETKMTLIR